MNWTRPLGLIPRFWALLKNRNPSGKFKWSTVASPEAPDTIQLVLEPNGDPAAKTCQRAIFDQGIPATACADDELQKEYARMKNWVPDLSHCAGSLSASKIAELNGALKMALHLPLWQRELQLMKRLTRRSGEKFCANRLR